MAALRGREQEEAKGGVEQRRVVAAAARRLADLPVTPPLRELGVSVGGAGNGEWVAMTTPAVYRRDRLFTTQGAG